MMPLRLVVVGVVIVIVSFIVLFLLVVLPLSVLVFNPATHISVANDVAQVTVVSTMLSTTLLRWSDATG
jgi:hypothetical protein